MPIIDETRQDRERNFHDQLANTIDLNELLVHESFEAPTAIENRYALKRMGSIAGKKILDLGCGTGESATYFATRGAIVKGCDISSGLLDVAKKLAMRHNTDVDFIEASATYLPFADNSFDFVFGNGVLHHVDLVPAAREINRVLKSNGKGFFVEPLPYNPAIEVYRHLAKQVRTKDETPLSFKQINQIKPLFSNLEHEEFWFFSLLIFLHFFLIKRWHPSKVRYWKQVLKEGENYKKLFTRLNRMDRWILRHLPFLKLLCWNTVLITTKK